MLRRYAAFRVAEWSWKGAEFRHVSRDIPQSNVAAELHFCDIQRAECASARPPKAKALRSSGSGHEKKIKALPLPTAL